MKQTKWIALAGMAAMIAVGSDAQAAASATATGTASAKIVAPMTITADNNSQLNFGSIAPSATAGTVTVGTDGKGTAVGGCSIVDNTKISHGVFNIAGAANMAVTVTLPSTATIESSESGSMEVSGFTARLGAAATDGPNGTLDSEGKLALAIGAKLAVAASQKAGEYSGTYPVSVAYN